MPAPKLRIESIRIVAIVDDAPDTSYLGEYTDQQSNWAIDRQSGEFIADLPEDHELPERGRDYRYFAPYAGGEKPGSADYRSAGKADFDRMEALNSGDWCYLGIRAEARIVVEGVSQQITSAGLWGVESDSGDDYLAEVGAEELQQLAEQLKALGFSARQIKSARPSDLSPVDR